MIKRIPYITSIILLGLLATHITLYSQIIISELQPAPISPEPEWVEIYNLSNQSFSCDICKISDANTSRNLPVFTIPSKGYALITKDSTALKDKYDIPTETTIIEVSLPALNNTGDEVKLYQGTTTLDSIYYGSGYEKGVSIEKIILDSPWTPENWGAAKQNSGSPGRANSIAPQKFGISVAPTSQTDEQIEVVIINFGTEQVELTSLYLNEIQYPFSQIIQPDSSYLSLLTIPETEVYGYSKFALSAAYIGGEEEFLLQSDSISIFAFPDTDIIINEVMYEPVEGMAEFYEIYYEGSKPLNLFGFLIGDASNRNSLDISNIDYIILPNSYLAIGSDSTIFEYSLIGEAVVADNFPTLNNSGDDIFFTYPAISNRRAIQIYYDPKDHDTRFTSTAGLSLELTNDGEKTQLRTSSDEHGSTPGRVNSWAWVQDIESGISIDPNPFDRNNPTQIEYNLFEGGGYIKASIYSETMAIVNPLIPGRPLSGKGYIEWNGTDKNGAFLPPGIYILVIEGISDLTSESTIIREIIVIGE